MQRYGDLSEETQREIAEGRATTRERFGTMPKFTLRGEARKEARAAAQVARLAKEQKRLEYREYWKDLNKGRVAERKAYTPLTEVSSDVRTVIDKKFEKKPKVPPAFAKEQRRMKIKALQDYDRQWGTKLAPRPAPATLKNYKGTLVSWNDVVRMIFAQMPDAPMFEKMEKASEIWKNAGPAYIRPDIVKRAEKTVENSRKTSYETKQKRLAAAERANEKAAQKAYLIENNPTAYAQLVAQEKFQRLLKKDQQAARAVQKRAGVKTEPYLKYAVRDGERYLASRAEFGKIYGKAQGAEMWKAAEPYAYGGETAAAAKSRLRRTHLKPYGSAKGSPIYGEGVYQVVLPEAEAEAKIREFEALRRFRTGAEEVAEIRAAEQAALERGFRLAEERRKYQALQEAERKRRELKRQSEEFITLATRPQGPFTQSYTQ